MPRKEILLILWRHWGFNVVSHHVMLPMIFLQGGISVARRPNKLRGGKLEFDSTKALEVNDKLTPGPFQYNAVGFQEYI